MPHKQIMVRQEIWERLKKRAKSSQALGGVIEDLLNDADHRDSKKRNKER